MKKPCSALSGGLRMRVALCMAFFIEADLLLLDEPTNHLDFPSVLWLENRLRGYKGSFLMVSHDRELLNNVCTNVLLIEDQQIKYYQMGFKEFETKKAAEDKKKSDDIEKFLQKNLNCDPSTPLGRERYDKKNWSDDYFRKQTALAGKFTFPAPVALENKEVDAEGNPVAADNISLINLQNVRFSYDVNTGHFIFNDPISFNVTATTRVGVMGPNGAGKSTLLKLLTHKLIPTEGSVVHHPNFTLAYFGQHSTAELDLELTAIEFMCQQFPTETAGTLRGHLAKTGIAGPVADTRMQRLSFSQRSCVIFSKLTFVCPHLLIMDEPTNFLDLESVDSLIGACNKYKGALLLVSHNRDFLRKCARQYLSIVPGHFQLYNTLKTAENATYSFIAEMEEGAKVGGSNLLTKNPGGGSVHSSQKVGGAEEKKDDKPAEVVGGQKVLSIGSGAPAVSKKAAPVVAVTYEVNEKCQALWKDGKYYTAQVKKVKGNEFTILFLEYGNTATVPATSLKKLDAKLAAAPAAKAAAAPAAKAAAPAAKAGGKK
jgi:ATPase subunit of ABC transporter with duplicated ATPase domains